MNYSIVFWGRKKGWDKLFPISTIVPESTIYLIVVFNSLVLLLESNWESP